MIERRTKLNLVYKLYRTYMCISAKYDFEMQNDLKI